jgi:hypothetical protein
MDLETTKNALHKARIAWHKAFDEGDYDEDCKTQDKLENAIAELQVFLPDYDPKANPLEFAGDP